MAVFGIEWKNLAKVLEEYGVEIRNHLQDSYITDDHIATGTLLNSVDYIFDINGYTYEISLSLDEVWKWVENDTKPHFPPPSAIAEWIRIKGIPPRPDSRGHIPSVEQAAWAIAKTIEKEGTTGTHNVERTLDEVNTLYMGLIDEAITSDISENIDAIMQLII